MNIETLVRSNVRNLKAYSSARSLYQSGIFFDANENAHGSVITQVPFRDLNRYPDPNSTELKRALAASLRVTSEQIFVGNGSDEAIDLLIRVFVNPGENILVLEPTYGMYRVAAETAGVEVRVCPLTSDFQIDVTAVLKAMTKRTKIVFCCSPNNPTGNLMRTADIRSLCSKSNAIVVLDEAYVEFASQSALTALVTEYDNLVVLRTFSKAWGLAGIRVGYAIASTRIIAYMSKVKAPYNLNRISSALALRALKSKSRMQSIVKTILKERKRLEKALQAMEIKVFPSDANFLLLQFPNASSVARTIALKTKLIIRDFGNKKGLEDCVRFSVSTKQENNKLISALKKYI